MRQYGVLTAIHRPGVVRCGFSVKKDLLAQLLELNLPVAQRLEHDEPVTAPGIPASVAKPETLISEDCIRPAVLA